MKMLSGNREHKFFAINRCRCHITFRWRYVGRGYISSFMGKVGWEAPSLETQPNCVDVTLKLGSAAEVACHFAVSGDRLPNHTEGHRLNGRDELSRKAGLRLGKDSTGVEEYPNQDKLHNISVLLWDLNPGLPDGRPRR